MSDFIRHNEFRKNCRLVNLKYEYPGLVGDIEWLIVSDYSEKELQNRYSEEIGMYSPYVVMSEQVYRPVIESKSNELKHARREKRHADLFGFVDGEMEKFHPETWVDARDPFMYESLYESINSLSTVQRSRVIDYFFRGFNMREIAERQGVSIQSVSQSIERSLKMLRENIG